MASRAAGFEQSAGEAMRLARWHRYAARCQWRRETEARQRCEATAPIRACILDYEDLQRHQAILAHRIRKVSAKEASMEQLNLIRDFMERTKAGELQSGEVSFHRGEGWVRPQQIRRTEGTIKQMDAAQTRSTHYTNRQRGGQSFCAI